MSEKRDYYEVLGIERGASAAEIKAAYRKMAVRFHPDKNPGDATAEEKFKEAAEAYAVLSDSDKRARYDRFGHQGVAGAGGGGAAGFDPTIFGDFSDILGDLFGFAGGGRGGRPGVTRGADLRYDLTLSFEEAAFGTDATLRVPRLERCDSCRGTGGAGGKEPSTCSACSGRGQVRFTQGFFTVARPCPQCQGEGRVVTDPCKECRGQGRVEKERTLEVRIPAGVDSGARMRLSGEGEHGRGGGPAGDLYVVLDVERHALFRRDGATVHARQRITFPQAVLGAKLDIETVHGKNTLDIPPGTPHGREFRLRGQGVARLDGGGKGDHVVTVQLEVPHPRDLDEEQLDLLRKMAELSGDPVREEKGVVSRLKDLFA